jgi:hypothetical protein
VALRLHEGIGLGHTLSRHVAITDDGLRDRLATRPRLLKASRFYDLRTAEESVSAAIQDHASEIRSWLETGVNKPAVDIVMPRDVGVVAQRDGSLTPTRFVVVVPRVDTDGMFVFTAYPELPS